jgi:hypothetical protein
VISATEEAGILNQSGTPAADNLALYVSAPYSLHFIHGSNLFGSVAIPIGSVVDFGVTENPGEPVRVYVDGRFRVSGATSLCRGPAANTTLKTDNSTNLLGLAIWIGRALQTSDFKLLHADPLAFFVEDAPILSPLSIVAPPIADGPYTRVVDMPSRPWWRRWPHRKIDR